MDDGSASIFCFTPLRVTVSELDRLRAAPPSPESSLGPVGSAPAIPQGPCPVGPSDSSTELIALVEDLRREVAELRAEVDRLERENLEFRQQVGYWKSRHRDALDRIAALEQKVEQLEGEKRQLQADLFGRRSETTTAKRSLQSPGRSPRRLPGTPAEAGPATGEPRTQATGLLPSAGPREVRRTASRAMCLPRLRSTVTASAVTPKTPSKSRSRCVPIAG